MNDSIFKDIINPSWIKVFESIDPLVIKETEENYLKLKDDENVFPKFEDIFNFTKYCNFEDIKVLCIGQDPYPNVFYDKIDKEYYPQAMGLAFSVHKKSPIPASLANIYDNLQRFGHIESKPTHGNLEDWARQGVLLLNTSLTVKKSKPNSHQIIWSDFTDELIKSITEKHTDLVIVMWGASAFGKMKIIKNQYSHKFVISSHPSPLGFKNKMKNYDSFYNTDHFGTINNILASKNITQIDWKII